MREKVLGTLCALGCKAREEGGGGETADAGEKRQGDIMTFTAVIKEKTTKQKTRFY